MAITVVEKLIDAEGSLRKTIIDLDGPASYLADGQTLTATDFGFRQILWAGAGASDNGDQFCAVNHTPKGTVKSVRVQWFVSSTGAEVADAVDLSARFVRVIVIGR